MDDVETAILFLKCIEEKDFNALSKLMANDFKYLGPTPDPFDKNVWLSFQKAVQYAFPDWDYHLKKVEKTNDGVDVTVEITGTHLQELVLPWPDVKPIPATGIKVHLPEEKATLKFKNDKVRELRVHTTLHGGLPGVMEQLRME